MLKLTQAFFHGQSTSLTHFLAREGFSDPGRSPANTTGGPRTPNSGRMRRSFSIEYDDFRCHLLPRVQLDRVFNRKRRREIPVAPPFERQNMRGVRNMVAKEPINGPTIKVLILPPGSARRALHGLIRYPVKIEKNRCITIKEKFLLPVCLRSV